MHLSPQSKSILDKLLTGGAITAGKITIGPLDQTTQLLLQVVIDNYNQLSTTHGQNQADSLLKCYLTASKAKSDKSPSTSTPADTEDKDKTATAHKAQSPQSSTPLPAIPNFPIPSAWRLHNLKCSSIKGVAPRGEEFPFSFDGKSNLIFGLNGSGKSSLLGAVIWVLTGETLTDAAEPKDIASIHRTSKDTMDTAKGSKICDWPAISTLPDTDDPRSVTPDSLAQIELKSSDESNIIYLRRSLTKGLEIKVDNSAWNPCANLSPYGISALDLQLSLIAPTIFGRQAIETAPDARRLLSLMLGYDALEDIGNLASNIARNRTSLFNTLISLIATDWGKLKIKLASLPTNIPAVSHLRKPLETFVLLPKPSLHKIQEIAQKVTDEITSSSASLAEILGIIQEDSPIAPDLAENLIKSIGYLEKGFIEVWPSLSSIELQSALPEKDGLSPEEQLAKLQQNIECFTTNTKAKIAERLKWWRKEIAPGSKAKLLLTAAKDYDPAKMECPVCEQSIKDLPVKDKLESLKTMDRELIRDVDTFFTNLSKELDNTLPQNLRAIAKILPPARLMSDWDQLKNKKIAPELSSVPKDFETPVKQIAANIKTIKVETPVIFPEDAESGFLNFAKDFLDDINVAYTALAILCWSNTDLDSIKEKVHHAITASPTENPDSLLAILSKGKKAATEISPLKTVLNQLSEVKTNHQQITETQTKLNNLEVLREPLNKLKNLSKYAINKTTAVFKEVKAKAARNWKLLYPESSIGLYPSRLIMGKGKDKSVESMLTQGNYEVPGQFFGNAGLQRAIALSFLCAMFDKHPSGLGFVIFDDPILSLDDEHRERWSGEILSPRMQNTQVILATHQMQFLTNCRHDFANGKVVELNPRDRKRRISWQPGDYLDKAENLLNTNWQCVPGILYKYCEELLETLDSYSPDAFFVQDNLTKSLNDYEKLTQPNPLAGTRQKQIVAYLRNPEVERVHAGRHASTQHNVTKPMVEDSLRKIKKIDNYFKSELKHLKRLRSRRQRGSIIQISAPEFQRITGTPISQKPLVLPVLGRAAARLDSWVLDTSEEVTSTKLLAHTSAFISSNTLNPVVRYGQCVLLAHEDNQPEDDDLVAIVSSDGNRYLRRITWSDEDSLVLQSIHPLKRIPTIHMSKAECAMRKVIGVIYEPPTRPSLDSSSKTFEWYPYNDLKKEMITSLKTIIVEGNSLDPIARKGQKVLVSEPRSPQTTTLEPGGLAALEIDDGDVGNVIKRIYRQGENWMLLSPNQVEPHTPDLIPVTKIKQVWPLRGVLFETIDD